MKEYFVATNSFAAPFFSDSGNRFVSADSPADALNIVADTYAHPCGLFSAAVYESADDMHKGLPALAQWLCETEIAKQELTKELGSYTMLGISPGVFELNGVRHEIANPKSGRIIIP